MSDDKISKNNTKMINRTRKILSSELHEKKRHENIVTIDIQIRKKTNSSISMYTILTKSSVL